MTPEKTSTPPNVAETVLDALGPAFDTFVDLAIRIWWFWAIVGAVLLLQLVVLVGRHRRLTRSGIQDIDAMSGRTYEHYMRTVFTRLAYDVQLTKYRGDFGADLVVSKDGVKTAVQAKRYSKNVGVKAVQEAVAAKGYYDADAAMVVTNRFYTQQAKMLARKNGVTLWDRDKLIAVLLDTDTRDAVVGTTPKAATEERPPDAVCAACGVGVSEKVRDYCTAHAERFRGAIYCFSHQRFRPGPS